MLQFSLFEDVPVITKVTPKTLEEYDKLTYALQTDFDRHQALLTVGGLDPFWPDGMNLHLKRNHILFGKRELYKLHEQYGLDLPDIYFVLTPDEVNSEYQAPGSKSGKLYNFSK